MKARSWLIASGALIALIALAMGAGVGEARAEGAGSVLFAHGTDKGVSIWRMDVGGKGKPDELIEVGAGTVTRIHVSDDGATVIIEKDDEVLWARPGGGAPVPARALDCKPHAHMSADGKHVACMDHSGNRVLIRLDPSPRKTVYGAAINTHIGFGGGKLISSDDKGVWAAPSARSSSGRALLAREPPHSHLLVAPSGKRAVGVYVEDGGSTALYGFRLDGKGVRRRLMKDAVPVAWSRDSRWLLVQDGKDACLIRAVGGQYKCWRRYQGVGIAPDGSYALLVKDRDSDSSRDGDGADHYTLYRGRRDGVRPETPAVVRSPVHPAAAWLAAD